MVLKAYRDFWRSNCFADSRPRTQHWRPNYTRARCWALILTQGKCSPSDSIASILKYRNGEMLRGHILGSVSELWHPNTLALQSEDLLPTQEKNCLSACWMTAWPSEQALSCWGQLGLQHHTHHGGIKRGRWQPILILPLILVHKGHLYFIYHCNNSRLVAMLVYSSKIKLELISTLETNKTPSNVNSLYCESDAGIIFVTFLMVPLDSHFWKITTSFM